MALSQIQWPISLPQRPDTGSYTESPTYDIEKSQFETGPQRQRKRSSYGLETRQVKYLLNNSQRQTLRDFLDVSAGRSFWWPDPTASLPTEDVVYRYVRTDNKAQIQSEGSSRFSVTLNLTIWPLVTRS